MNVLIIENEELAAKKLIDTLLSVEPDSKVIEVSESIDSSVKWLSENPSPDLILMDIGLTDGQSFEILSQFDVQSKVIFISSKDENALKPLKFSGIDYLLKPVRREELAVSLVKFYKFRSGTFNANNVQNFFNLSAQFHASKQKKYRKRFLVKNLRRLVSVNVSEIAYFYSDEKVSFFKTFDDRRFIVDYTMDKLEAIIDPEQFFRIGRAFLVSPESIYEIHDYFGHRLLLELIPTQNKECLVSREKVGDFKQWLGK